MGGAEWLIITAIMASLDGQPAFNANAGKSTRKATGRFTQAASTELRTVARLANPDPQPNPRFCFHMSIGAFSAMWRADISQCSEVAPSVCKQPPMIARYTFATSTAEPLPVFHYLTDTPNHRQTAFSLRCHFRHGGQGQGKGNPALLCPCVFYGKLDSGQGQFVPFMRY